MDLPRDPLLSLLPPLVPCPIECSVDRQYIILPFHMVNGEGVPCPIECSVDRQVCLCGEIDLRRACFNQLVAGGRGCEGPLVEGNDQPSPEGGAGPPPLGGYRHALPLPPRGRGRRPKAGRGRGSPVSWSFESISNFTYRRVVSRRVFAWRRDLARSGPGGGIDPDGLARPGDRKRRLSIHQMKLGARVIPISKDNFERGVRDGTIPGSWFEDPGSS